MRLDAPRALWRAGIGKQADSHGQRDGMHRWQAAAKLAAANGWGAGPGRPGGEETWCWGKEWLTSCLIEIHHATCSCHAVMNQCNAERLPRTRRAVVRAVVGWGAGEVSQVLAGRKDGCCRSEKGSANGRAKAHEQPRTKQGRWMRRGRGGAAAVVGEAQRGWVRAEGSV